MRPWPAIVESVILHLLKEIAMRSTQRVQWPACAGLLLAVACAGSAGAGTIRVEAPGLIASGLAAASAGDTVLVACGVYQEQGLVMPEGVVLRGESGDPACAVIASLGGASILVCEGITDATRIEGLTFAMSDVGFPAPVVGGGGVSCEAAQPQFADCVFNGLIAGYGGAVFCRDGSPRFVGCDFLGNTALAAGGAVNCIGASQPVFERCLLAGNSTAGAGGAVNAAAGARPAFVRCTIAGGAGGGLASWNAPGSALDASIVALNGGAAWAGDVDGVPLVGCTDIWGNGSDWSGGLADQAGVRDNLSADPIFCGAPVPEQPWGLDVTSPCAPDPACGLRGARDVSCDLATGIDDPPPGEVPPLRPEVTELLGNRPNPFNPATTISFALRRPGPVSITVYDVAGRVVKTLVAASYPAGFHEVTWRGDDRGGRQAAAGVYFLRLDADGIYDTLRVALVK